MAQQRWLMNNDADWRKKTNGTDEDVENAEVKGFDIEVNVTYNRKEDLELQKRMKKSDEGKV